MVLKGVDEINWFTVRPDRVEGTWKTQKLLRQWDKLFTDSQPNAQATFEMGSKRKLVTFEMFKPKLSDSNQTLSFKVRGIGEKNNNLLTGLKNKQLSDASLFIDESPLQCLPNCEGADLIDALLIGAKLDGADLSDANLTYAVLKSATMADVNLTNANLTNAFLFGTFLYGANLSGADLSEANLIGATMADANLTGANLNGAYLNGAYFSNTICPDGSMNSGTSPCTAEQLNLV